MYERGPGQAERSVDTRLKGKVATKADGKFTFSTAINSDSYSHYLVAEKEGFAFGWTAWDTQRDEAKEPEIRLGQQTELAGLIVDENDRPIPQAQVGVCWLATGKRLLANDVVPELLTTETDQAGRFAFTNLPSKAKVEFLARKTGYANAYTYTISRDMKYTIGQTDIKLALVKEAMIEGVVVEEDSAKPVPGVRVSILREGNRSIAGQSPAKTKEDGTFNLNALAAGNYVVQILRMRAGSAEWVAEPAKVKLKAGHVRKDLRIEACKGGMLEVRITDAQSEQPLEKARVNVSNGRNQHIHGGSDKNGIARVRLMPGEWRITYLAKPGYKTQMQRGNTITVEDGKTVRVERQLAAPPKITGIVRDEDNRPVKGAMVNIHPIGSRYDVTTDAEGKFEVSWSSQMPMPSWYGTTLWLMARHEGRNLAAIDENVTKDTRVCDIELKPGVIITGKVAEPDGTGIPGANLMVTLKGPKWPLARLKSDSSRADGNGEFEIRAVPSGHSCSIKAEAERYGSIRAEFHSDAAKDQRLALEPLTLPVANLSVSGVVVDTQGHPIPKATISFSNARGQPERLATQTDSEGRFNLDGVCEGQLYLRVSTVYDGKRLSATAIANGGATGLKVIVREGRPGRSAVQSLRVKTYDQIIRNSERVIAGVALDEKGSPVAGVPVSVCCHRKKRPDGTFSWKFASSSSLRIFTDLKATTDKRGRFGMELKDDGEYNLLFSPDRHAPLIVYDVPAGKKNLNVTLSEGGAVAGRLLQMNDGRKVPIPNVELKIDAADHGSYTHLGPGHERTTVTDAEGRFRFEHLRTKIRPAGTMSEQRWDYIARIWTISYGNTSQSIAFYEDAHIDNLELLVKPNPAEAQSLLGAALPGFDNIKIDLPADRIKNKMALVCFWDMNQRPSRNCVLQLAKRATELKRKDVVVVIVQASKVGQSVLDGWMRENGIPFTVGIIKGDEEKTRFAWGAKSLPWLILTDAEHVIRAEGFALNELSEKLERSAGE